MARVESGFPSEVRIDSNATAVSSVVDTITTAGPSVVVVAILGCNLSGTAWPETSVAGGTLGAFTRVAGASGNVFGSNGVGLWWKASTAALSKETITATWPATLFAGGMVTWSVTGAAASPIGASSLTTFTAAQQLSTAIAAKADNSVILGIALNNSSSTALTALAASTPWQDQWSDTNNCKAFGLIKVTTTAAGSLTVGASDAPTQGVVGVLEILDGPILTESSGAATADVLLDAYGPIRFVQRTAFQPNAFQENAFQILGGQTGGPFTYNESVSASALAQDVLQTAQGFAQPDSYSALAQDQTLAAVGFNASEAESALAQDIALGAQGFAAPLSESALAREALAAAEGLNAGESESALAQDQFATAEAMLAALSESALAQDTALPAMQMAASLLEGGLADVLFDSTLIRPGTGTQYDESLIESCLAQEALSGAQGTGSGIEAKIGGAGVGTSIFVFDD